MRRGHGVKSPNRVNWVCSQNGDQVEAGHQYIPERQHVDSFPWASVVPMSSSVVPMPVFLAGNIWFLET